MNKIDPKINPQDAMLQQKVEKLKQQSQNPRKLKETAEDFESLFVQYMLQNMRRTVMKSGFIETGLGGNIMESLFDQKLSQKIASSSQLGIAELLLNQLASQKEADVSAPRSLKGLPLRPIGHNPMKRNAYRGRESVDRVSAFDSHIRNAAKETGVDSNLIRAVIMAESGGNPRAVSTKNARGLMQLLDSTAAEMGVKNPLNPEENINGGSRYLAKMLKHFNGNAQLAVAAYNAGPTAVEKYSGIPPYRETEQYVNRVFGYYEQFRKLGL